MPFPDAAEGLMAEGRQSRRRGLHNSERPAAGPAAVINYLPRYSCISVALHLAFVSAERRTASSVMTNKSRMCSDVRRRSCFRFPNGNGFVYFKGYNHNSSFSSACFVLDAL